MFHRAPATGFLTVDLLPLPHARRGSSSHPPIPHLPRKSPQHSTAPGGRIRLITDSSRHRARDPWRKGRSTPARLRPGQPGTGSCVPPSAAHEIRVYVYPAAEELKHGRRRRCWWRRRRSGSLAQGRHECDHINLFVLLLVLFVIRSYKYGYKTAKCIEKIWSFEGAKTTST